MEPNEPFNPYAPPRSATDAPVEYGRLDSELASRGQRLGGALFDGLLGILGVIPAYFGGTSMAAIAQKGVKIKNPFFLYTHTGTGGVIAAVVTAAILAVQWYLLVKRGQTLGKMVAGSRIVMKDGSRAGFVNVLVLRAWPVWVLGHMAAAISIFALVGLIDDLTVFRADRRCLHDLIAGTKVVRARAG